MSIFSKKHGVIHIVEITVLGSVFIATAMSYELAYRSAMDNALAFLGEILK